MPGDPIFAKKTAYFPENASRRFFEPVAFDVRFSFNRVSFRCTWREWRTEATRVATSSRGQATVRQPSGRGAAARARRSFSTFIGLRSFGSVRSFVEWTTRSTLLWVRRFSEMRSFRRGLLSQLPVPYDDDRRVQQLRDRNDEETFFLRLTFETDVTKIVTSLDTSSRIASRFNKYAVQIIRIYAIELHRKSSLATILVAIDIS